MENFIFRTRLDNRSQPEEWQFGEPFWYYHKYLNLLTPGDLFTAVKNSTGYILICPEKYRLTEPGDPFRFQKYKCKVTLLNIFKLEDVEKRYINSKLRNQIIEDSDSTCQWCSQKTSKPQIDHIQPWAFMGETKRNNLQVLCSECNQLKRKIDENKFIEKMIVIKAPIIEQLNRPFNEFDNRYQ